MGNLPDIACLHKIRWSFTFDLTPAEAQASFLIAHLVCWSFQVGLATALRYALSRRCFSPADGQPELRILDYPSHQRRLLPLLAKT